MPDIVTNTYFVGFGSNVDPRRHLHAALDRLVGMFGVVAVGTVAQTAPVKCAGGPFLNAVVSFRSAMTPLELKDVFCALEAAWGRDRSLPDRARRERTVDLDLLFHLPPGVREVDASLIPPEPYYHAASVELAGFLGLTCGGPACDGAEAVAGPGAPGPVAVAVGSETIGLQPVRLHRPVDGPIVVSRARRAALVTGGAVRVGREIAHTLAREGYDIALHYNTSGARAADTAGELRALGVRCESFGADFADPACLPGLVDAVAERFPHAELLVNSASVYEGGDIAHTTPELLDRQWAVNFKAPFLLMKEWAARLERGAVVNVLDNKVAFNQFHYAAYLTAKKALAEATRMAALEFAPRFRVNGLSPGVIMPAGTRDSAYLEWRQEGIPARQLGNPGQLCQALALLAANPFITGQILAVDGGESVAFTGRNAHDFRTASGRLKSADRHDDKQAA